MTNLVCKETAELFFSVIIFNIYLDSPSFSAVLLQNRRTRIALFRLRKAFTDLFIEDSII